MVLGVMVAAAGPCGAHGQVWGARADRRGRSPVPHTRPRIPAVGLVIGTLVWGWAAGVLVRGWGLGALARGWAVGVPARGWVGIPAKGWEAGW